MNAFPVGPGGVRSALAPERTSAHSTNQLWISMEAMMNTPDLDLSYATVMTTAFSGRLVIARALGRHFLAPTEDMADPWLTDLGPDLHNPGLELPPIKVVTFPFYPDVLSVCQNSPLRWDYVVYVIEKRARQVYDVMGYVSRADFVGQANLSR